MDDLFQLIPSPVEDNTVAQNEGVETNLDDLFSLIGPSVEEEEEHESSRTKEPQNLTHGTFVGSVSGGLPEHLGRSPAWPIQYLSVPKSERVLAFHLGSSLSILL